MCGAPNDIERFHASVATLKRLLQYESPPTPSMGPTSRTPILCDNTTDAIDALTKSLLDTGSDKAVTLQRLWAVCHLDKASVATTVTQGKTLEVVLQMRLASPDVNYWLSAFLEAVTATHGFAIHDVPALKQPFLAMLDKLLKVPDPTGVYLDSKCTAAACVVNLVHMGGAAAAAMITENDVAAPPLLPHLCDLLEMKRTAAQLVGLRALWRVAYYCPHVRPLVVAHTKHLNDSTNKDLARVLQHVRGWEG
ncbi:Aste57867_17963 [Aphanomyces stellatus]|uniref:Aste57867_17963 protein n=1 Tax=Aphanomyces stellatus TaxID=120398 RepID=A0A485LAH8_9STRA|nr:hypothetical protein As57867_017901 [Aphanomyces stellatus]VFT94703.1 Aste57867_17963 [Aphanomyces stellatus]